MPALAMVANGFAYLRSSRHRRAVGSGGYLVREEREKAHHREAVTGGSRALVHGDNKAHKAVRFRRQSEFQAVSA